MMILQKLTKVTQFLLIGNLLGISVAVTAQDTARVLTLVYPFIGEQASFEKFQGAMGRQLGTIGEQLCDKLNNNDDAFGCVDARTEAGEELINFGGLKIQKATYEPGTVSLSSNEQYAKWTDPPDTLQVWEGEINVTDTQTLAKTKAYLGRLKGKLPLSIEFSHPITIENNAAAKNSLMALTLYILAMDARRQGFTDSVVISILSEAKSRSQDLDLDISENELLVIAIDKTIQEILQ